VIIGFAGGMQSTDSLLLSTNLLTRNEFTVHACSKVYQLILSAHTDTG